MLLSAFFIKIQYVIITNIIITMIIVTITIISIIIVYCSGGPLIRPQEQLFRTFVFHDAVFDSVLFCCRSILQQQLRL